MNLFYCLNYASIAIKQQLSKKTVRNWNVCYDFTAHITRNSLTSSKYSPASPSTAGYSPANPSTVGYSSVGYSSVIPSPADSSSAASKYGLKQRFKI